MKTIRLTLALYHKFCKLRKIFTGHTESELIEELIDYYNQSTPECEECGAIITDNYNKKDLICDNCQDNLINDSKMLQEHYNNLQMYHN